MEGVVDEIAAIPLDIAPFTLVGATTRAGLLPAPLRDRFGFTAHLDFYQPDELEVIIRRSAGLLGVTLTDEGAAELKEYGGMSKATVGVLLREMVGLEQQGAGGGADDHGPARHVAEDECAHDE